MSNVEAMPENAEKPYEVITYEEEVEFKYTLPDEEEPRAIERELTIVWEDSVEKFIEEHGKDKAYRVHSFKRERERNFFLDQLEGRMDDLMEEVEEEIANKMKFGFEFSGQLHNDD